jgi:hypothetical protein
MASSILLSPRRLAIWLAALVSPTAYFVFLAFADRTRMPPPPWSVVAGLFVGIPLVATWICGKVVWSSGLTRGGKLGWIAATLIAMALQVAALLLILVIAITAAIAY